MIRLPRIKIADKSAFPPGTYKDFDPKTLSQFPLVLKRGQARYRLGVIQTAYKGTEGIFADILLLGNWALGFRMVDEKLIPMDMEYIPEKGPTRARISKI